MLINLFRGIYIQLATYLWIPLFKNIFIRLQILLGSSSCYIIVLIASLFFQVFSAFSCLKTYFAPENSRGTPLKLFFLSKHLPTSPTPFPPSHAHILTLTFNIAVPLTHNKGITRKQRQDVLKIL